MLPSIEWRGACYLGTDAVIDGGRVSENGRPVPRLVDEALISWLSSVLWGGFFKERYAPVIREAVEIDGAAFQESLIEVAGKKWGARLWQAAREGRPEISAEWTRSLRRAVWWRSWVKAPARTLQRYLAFVVAELKLRLEPTVPWIAILGSDGSGKSSLVKMVVHRFASCPYANVESFHWRPRVIARTLGAELVTDPHRRPCRGLIGSVLSLVVLTADWLVGYWTELVHLRAKGAMLVFDRMYFDLVVDPKRYRYGAGPWLARALWRILPKPDLVFLLDAAPEVVWDRKQEVALPELARQRQAYRALIGQLPGGQVLDGRSTPWVLADVVQRTVRAWMLERSTASVTSAHGSLVTGPVGRDDGSTGAPMLIPRNDGKITDAP